MLYIELELDRIRTCDPRLKRAVLYLLSYQPDERIQTIENLGRSVK